MDSFQRARDCDSLLGTIKHPDFGFSEYGLIYPFTNENSRIALKDVHNGTSALSVLAGGDQVFDLALKGYREFTTFDINRYTEYFVYGLKKTAIEQLSYDDFLILFSDDYNNAFEIFENIIDKMPEEYIEFWIRYANLLIQDIESKGICVDLKRKYWLDLISMSHSIPIPENIGYLQSKHEFNKLKDIIDDCHFSFIPGDLSLLKISKKYDFIYFSNILQYIFSRSDMMNIIRKYAGRNLEPKGEIVNSFLNINNYDGVINISDKLYFDGNWHYSLVRKK